MSEGVFLERSISLDDSEVITRKCPDISLLGADATVTGATTFDLGKRSFIDEGTAVTIATIGLGRLISFGHDDI